MVDEPIAIRESSASPDPALDGAWRIHDAQISWIEKADVKASIILALETAVLGFVTVLSTDGRVLTGLHGPRRAVDVAAMALLLFSTLFSLSTIIPRLGHQVKAKNDLGVIYFGDVRHWTPADLADKLRQGRPTNQGVAEQAVILAEISWSKHVRLRRSIVLLSIGVLLFGVSLGWPGR